MSAEFDFMSATELRRLVSARAVSPVDLVRRALDHAESTQATLNAFFVIMPNKAVAQTTSHSRELIFNVLHGLARDIFRVRRSSLESYFPEFHAERVAGCYNWAEFQRRFRMSGFQVAGR